MTFLKGALPRNDDGSRPVFEQYLRGRGLQGSLPSTPQVVDRATGDLLQMYMNNVLGDCTTADMLNLFTAVMFWSKRFATKGGTQFTDAEAVKVYSATGGYVSGDPSTDNGATLESVCEYGVSTGFVSNTGNTHKIAGWAEVGDFTNLQLLKQIANTFGAVYLGVAVDDADMANTNNGKPWALSKAGPNVGPDGCDHCVALLWSAFGDTAVADQEEVGTWGQLQKLNDNWASTNIGQAIVVVTQDWVDLNGTTIEGLNLTQLLKDSQGL